MRRRVRRSSRTRRRIGTGSRAPARWTSVGVITAALLTVAAAASGARFDQNLSMQRQVVRGGAASVHAEKQRKVGSVVGPLAQAASVNSVVSPFTLHFNYDVVNSQKLLMHFYTVSPVRTRLGEDVRGGCTHCTGPGFFKIKVRRDTVYERARGGAIFISRRTKFPEAVIRPGHIGRYVVYGVRFGVTARTPVLAQGCLAADTGLTNEALLRNQPLPTVPCGARVLSDSFTFNHPTELSPGALASVTGRVSGSRQLSVFLSHQRCAADPQAEVARSTGHAYFSVRGSFRDSVTSTTTRPGVFCVYLQTGGRYGGIPDGRLTAFGSFPFLAGDTVSISAPTTATVDQAVPVIFSGNASAAEELYVFTAYGPCASSAQAEVQQSAGALAVPLLRGAFSRTISTVPLARPAVVCAYLQLGAPASNGAPTGPTLAAATQPIAVQ